MSMEAGGGGDDDGDHVRAPLQVDADDDRPVTYDEKRLLSLAVNMLPGPELGNVVRIIRTVQPALQEHSDEFEIDFELLEPATLRAVERFVKEKVPHVYEDPDILNQSEDDD